MDLLATLLQGPAAAALAAAVAFLSGFVEGLAIPFPGTWVLAVVGGTSPHNAWSVLGLALLASTGYTLGAAAPYILGSVTRDWGLPSASRRFGLTEQRVKQLDTWFHRYGEPAVFWSRPFWIGNFVSIPAGMASMSLWRFFPYTFAGILPWAVSVLWLGGAAGALLEDAGSWAAWAALGGAVVVFLAWRLRQRRGGGQPGGAHPSGGEDGDHLGGPDEEPEPSPHRNPQDPGLMARVGEAD